MVRFSLNIKTCCLYVTWEIQDQIWANIFCSPKNVHSCTPMFGPPLGNFLRTPLTVIDPFLKETLILYTITANLICIDFYLYFPKTAQSTLLKTLYNRSHQHGARGRQVARTDHVDRLQSCSDNRINMISVFTLMIICTF